MRNRIIANVSTENSFETLSEDEIDTDDENCMNKSVKLNRSYPDIDPKPSKNDYSDYIYTLKEKNKELEKKLGSADAEIEKLLAENSMLEKKVINYELKIKQLETICSSPNTLLNTENKAPKRMKGKQLNFIEKI
ncbi:unnamed protein product [Parnassius apollo]|uniref:(apollo) hypothetical protein n=1 Tax=Parnassius apollo TaxID=110799 RepID=A0A8S3Y5R1_PARAO|nr:unnamed protein product [Parnassius apollo]